MKERKLFIRAIIVDLSRYLFDFNSTSVSSDMQSIRNYPDLNLKKTGSAVTMALVGSINSAFRDNIISCYLEGKNSTYQFSSVCAGMATIGFYTIVLTKR